MAEPELDGCGAEFIKELNALCYQGTCDWEDRRIIKIVAERPGISNGKIAKAMGMCSSTVTNRIRQPHMIKLITMIQGTVDDLIMEAARKGALHLLDIMDEDEHKKKRLTASMKALDLYAKRAETEAMRSKAIADENPLPDIKEAKKILAEDPATIEIGEVEVEDL